MIVHLLAEVPVPPELAEPAAAAIEAAVAGAVGVIVGLLPGVRDALVTAAKWLVHLVWFPVRILQTYVNDLNHALAGLDGWAQARLAALTQSVASMVPTTIVQVQTDISGVLAGINDAILHAQTFAVGVAEDLYNRSTATAMHVQDFSVGVAEDLYNRARAWSDTVGQEVLADAEGLYNSAVAHADAVGQAVLGSAEDLYNGAIAHANTIVAPLEGEIADTRTWAQALVATAGAATLAQAITAAEAAFGDCCDFVTGQAKPAWGKVRNLLGKLTSRGPLALVVLGAAGETVAAFDRQRLVAALAEARRRDGGQSTDALRRWGGYS